MTRVFYDFKPNIQESEAMAIWGIVEEVIF